MIGLVFNLNKLTFPDARTTDKTINMSDTNDLLKTNVERKKQLRGYNSFVARDANCEYQNDSMFLSDLKI